MWLVSFSGVAIRKLPDSSQTAVQFSMTRETTMHQFPAGFTAEEKPSGGIDKRERSVDRNDTGHTRWCSDAAVHMDGTGTVHW